MAVPRKFLHRGHSHVGVYVRGNSMEPILRNGFIVVVDTDSRDMAKLKNHMVVARIDGKNVVKWLAQNKPERIILRSQNTEGNPDIVIENSLENPVVGDVVFWWGIQ